MAKTLPRVNARTLPRADEITARLLGVPTGQHWVISCYLKLEPRDRSRGKYLIKLKNRIRGQERWADERGLPRAERQQIEKDLARIHNYLEHPSHLPAGRGIAIFASSPINLFEAIALPWVFRSRLAVDRTPLVRQVAAIGEEFGVMLAAAYDRTAARLFRLTAFGIEDLTDLWSQSTRAGRFHGASAPTGKHTAMGASGEHNYHQRLREERHRHYARIADQLFRLHKEEPAQGIVLGGIGAEAGAVEPFLHPYLRSLVLGTARLNPKSATENDVFTAALELRQAREREFERRHVTELAEQLPHGWAVNGIAVTLRALASGQVRTLLVDPEATAPGYRCRGSGRLAVGDQPCRGEGDPELVADVIDEAIEEALAQRAEVDVVFEAEARRAVDGLAALLRFRGR